MNGLTLDRGLPNAKPKYQIANGVMKSVSNIM